MKNTEPLQLLWNCFLEHLEDSDQTYSALMKYHDKKLSNDVEYVIIKIYVTNCSCFDLLRHIALIFS